MAKKTEANEPAPGHVKFVANPTQKLFIEHRPFDGFVRPKDWPDDVAPRVVDLFSCRMGEGKSAALVWATWFYTRYNPGASCLLFRDTWENMRDTTLKEFFFWFPEGVFGEYLKSEKLFTWFPHTGLRGTVTFLGMDEEKDAAKLQSRFFGLIGVDEPSPAAGTGGIEEMIFEVALSRLRQQNMQWYALKMAQNNPDESHWTYKRFVDPGTPEFTHFKTRTPENTKHLPPGYYQQMSKDFVGRPDLQRRFVKGEFGFQQLGVPVTPLWSDDVHLMDALEPVKGGELWLSWDGGATPVCVICELMPSGVLLVLDALAETHGGTYQLIEDQVFPLLETRYAMFRGQWSHTGDPSLETGDQSDISQSPVRRIQKMLGGRWVRGQKEIDHRVDPLNRRLGLLGPGGTGMVLVDRVRARGVHHALRGGWHRAKHGGGTTSPSPVKNHPHSDFGDAMGYLAGTLFPYGHERVRTKGRFSGAGYARYSSATVGATRSLRLEAPRIPKEFRKLP